MQSREPLLHPLPAARAKFQDRPLVLASAEKSFYSALQRLGGSEDSNYWTAGGEQKLADAPFRYGFLRLCSSPKPLCFLTIHSPSLPCLAGVAHA